MKEWINEVVEPAFMSVQACTSTLVAPAAAAAHLWRSASLVHATRSKKLFILGSCR